MSPTLGCHSRVAHTQLLLLHSPNSGWSLLSTHQEESFEHRSTPLPRPIFDHPSSSKLSSKDRLWRTCLVNSHSNAAKTPAELKLLPPRALLSSCKLPGKTLPPRLFRESCGFCSFGISAAQSPGLEYKCRHSNSKHQEPELSLLQAVRWQVL